MGAVGDAIAGGGMGGRLWLYSNYHCNLSCSYCLTESSPGVRRRVLDAAAILAGAREARELGFTGVGITGGEPFLLEWMPALLAELAEILPVIVLSNATLFTGRRLAALEPLAGLPVRIQISLDSASPQENDAMRGPENFAKAVAAIPALVERGIGVRIATTLEDPAGQDPAERDRLCELHRSLGIGDEDHIVRPIIRRGRAVAGDMGLAVGFDEIEPELTITADGAFASPFGPTVRAGELDTDLLVTRTVAPLSVPAGALARLVGSAESGRDARLGIR